MSPPTFDYPGLPVSCWRQEVRTAAISLNVTVLKPCFVTICRLFQKWLQREKLLGMDCSIRNYSVRNYSIRNNFFIKSQIYDEPLEDNWEWKKVIGYWLSFSYLDYYYYYYYYHHHHHHHLLYAGYLYWYSWDKLCP